MSNGKKDAKEPSMADVLARLDAVEARNKQLEETNATLQRSTMQLMAAPPVAQAVTSPVNTPAKDTLPDPTEDPQGYAKAVEARAEANARALVENERNRDRSAQTQKERTDQLFADFGKKYPDIAKHKGRLEYVAGEVVKKAIARGVDGQKYIFQASDMFFDDVAKAYSEEFGEAPKKDTTPDGDSDPVSGDENDETNRTGGIFGGLESGHAPSGKSKAPKVEPVSGMVKELQDIQMKTGFY